MKTLDLGRERGLLGIMDTSTSVDCSKQTRCCRGFRSPVVCMIRCCGFPLSDSCPGDDDLTPACTCIVTGTFFGYRKSRISFCLYEDTRGYPFGLPEFSVPTAYLVREMQSGLLRVMLEYDRRKELPAAAAVTSSLFHVPVWSLYLNGRKVGPASVLKVMQSVS